jgi:hypothetical protein
MSAPSTTMAAPATGAVAGQQLGRRILTVGPGWGFGKRLSPIFSVNPSLVPFHPELVDLMARPSSRPLSLARCLIIAPITMSAPSTTMAAPAIDAAAARVAWSIATRVISCHVPTSPTVTADQVPMVVNDIAPTLNIPKNHGIVRDAMLGTPMRMPEFCPSVAMRGHYCAYWHPREQPAAVITYCCRRRFLTPKESGPARSRGRLLESAVLPGYPPFWFQSSCSTAPGDMGSEPIRTPRAS